MELQEAKGIANTKNFHVFVFLLAKDTNAEKICIMHHF